MRVSGVNSPVSVFEAAIAWVEEKLGLAGQPQVIIFHEKKSRRHAHCVWSRIDAASMTAINLPHTRRKLQDLSRALYLEQGWPMPEGMIDPATLGPSRDVPAVLGRVRFR